MAKKGAREKIRLVSSEGTGHFYTASKNKHLHPDKMEVKKYDPGVQRGKQTRVLPLCNRLPLLR